MLEKPDIQDQLIASRLLDVYALRGAQVAFLPIGADENTAVYRVVSEDGTAYFLKLRGGVFQEITVAVPQFLKAHGIQPIIAPLETRDGQRWGSLEAYTMILYPFVQGRDGYEVALSDCQWIDLGMALQGVHTAQLPQPLARLIPREVYSPCSREMLREFQVQVEQNTFDDPTAAKLAAFMESRRAEISHVVGRAEQLALALQGRSLEFVLCHADMHAGNLLIGADGVFYIVDWDDPIYAPKERDLMFVAVGMGSAWPGEREEALFYQGYGQTKVDRMALAYYRYERIVQDMAAFGEQLFLTTEGGEDREQAYQYFTSIFLPNHELEIAYQTDTFRGT